MSAKPTIQIYDTDNAREIYIKAHNWYMINNQKREAKIFTKEVKKTQTKDDFLATLLHYFEVEVYRKP